MTVAAPSTLLIGLSAIDVPKRLRAVSQAAVDLLAAEIAESGFKGTVTVRPASEPGRYSLVAGAHRLAAMQQLGEAEIPAEVRVMTDDEARLWEINENLCRRELNAKDRAVFLLEAKRLRQRIDPSSRRGGARNFKVRNSDFDPSPFPRSFTTDMAERLGIKRTQVLEDIAFAERLDPEVLDMLDDTPLADNRSALIALSNEERDRQRGIVRDIKDGRYKTVGAALASRAGRTPPTKGDPQYGLVTTFAAAWDKLDDAHRAEALREITEGAQQRAFFLKIARRVLGDEFGPAADPETGRESGFLDSFDRPGAKPGKSNGHADSLAPLPQARVRRP